MTMDYQSVKSVIEQQAKDLGMPVRYQPNTACCNKKEVVLPGEVPTAMAMALLGVWYHEKKHIQARDPWWSTRYPNYLRHALNIVMDTRCDHRTLQEEPDGKDATIATEEYYDRKNPADKKAQEWHISQQICGELITRAMPHGVARGHTKNPVVKRWFKKHPKWRHCIADCKAAPDSDVGYKTLVRWSDWLLKEVFQADPNDQDQLKDLIDAMAAALGIPIKGDGSDLAAGPGDGSQPGLDPGRTSMDEIDPHDLEVPRPTLSFTDDLSQFFKEVMEEKQATETGAINPQRLPTYWQDPDDLFQQDEEKKLKKVRVYLVGDRSSSTKAILPNYDTVYQAIGTAMGIVCEAVRIVTDSWGHDIDTEVTAFQSGEEVIKGFGDPYDKGGMMRQFTRGVGGCTELQDTIERIEAEPTDADTKDFVFLITDGELMPRDVDMLCNLKGEKQWVIIGVGKAIKDKRVFKHVAQGTHELCTALNNAVKEKMTSCQV